MIRYGTIGTNKITNEFIEAATISRKWELTAVYDDDTRDAQAFADQQSGSTAFSDLNTFLQSDGLEAVFIASSPIMHFEQIKRAIQADKHVIVQPPAVTNPTEFAAIEQLLADHPDVRFFEAVYPLHMPNFENVAATLATMPAIQGATFVAMRDLPGYDQVLAGQQPDGFTLASAGGALQIVGLYPLYAALRLFGRPKKGSYFATAIQTGVDGLGAIFLEYPKFDVTLHIGITTDSFMPSEIYGLHEKIVIDNITELKLINHYDVDKQNNLLNTIPYANRLTGEALAIGNVLENLNDPEQQKQYASWLQLARDVHTTLFHLRSMVGIKFPTDR